MTRQGDCYYQAGDFANAVKCYIRTRDHSTTSAHTLETCFNVIKVGRKTKKREMDTDVMTLG